MSAPGNIIVIAGAGTGKTYKLVETCLNRLCSGAVNIDEILVVTFTKAAAAELRDRIGKALQTAIDQNPDSDHLQRQLALLDRAQVSTLHSFCLELVSRYFSELGLSPRLATLESAQATVLESEALDRVFENYYEAETPETKAIKQMLLGWFAGEDGIARAIVRDLHVFTHARPNPAQWFAEQRAIYSDPAPTLWQQWHKRAVEEWTERWRPAIEAQSADQKNPARGLVLANLAQLNVSGIEDIGNSADPAVWPRGSKEKFRKAFKKFYEESSLLSAWTSLPALREDWNLTRGLAMHLLKMAEDFGAEFARLKRERAQVDFADLEQFALQLLDREDSAAARYCRERFKYIFVDEYQDINRAQDRIITALARPEGNRFLVGDVKQSIYGFRQAEPAVFLNYEKEWNTREYLKRNWRSHERILFFVNNLFGSIMTEQTGGVSYDENARLDFADTPERAHLSAKNDLAPKVEVHLVDAAVDEDFDNEASSLAELERAEAEAEILAAQCRIMVERDGANYGDIVILMRSAASEVEAFAKVFSRHGIPFDARRTGFFNCIEVLDLTNLLTILDNPMQDIPLLGVLRSPIGCFSVQDLADVRAQSRFGTFWECLQKTEKGRAFAERYQRWRDLARHTSLAQRLEIILEESGYEDWVAAQDRGPQRRANVRRLIDLARQFDEIKGEGLYPFLEYVEQQTRAIGDIAPAAADSHGAVRLMTIHQSKGLQFPIVCVAGLAKKFNRQDFREAFLTDDEFGLTLRARPPGKRRQYDTIAFWMAKQRQEKRLLDEEMRLLYVALTRAEKKLLLVASPSKKCRETWQDETKRPVAANSLLDWIGPWLAKDCPQFCEKISGEAKDWTWRWHQNFTAPPQQPTQNANIETTPEILAALKERLDWIYPFQPATQQEAKTSATRLRRAFADEPELARPISAIKPIRKSKLAANEVGQAAHRLLELADFKNFENESALLAEMDRLNFTPEEKAALDPEKFLAFWHSPFGQELLAHSDQLQRELIFTAKFTRADLATAGAPIPAELGPDEFIVVQGAADLVAILPEEIWLVDFKTDRLPPALLEGRIKEYELQLKIYALALKRIYKRPVTRTCLHFLDTGRTEWIDRYQPGYLPLM